MDFSWNWNWNNWLKDNGYDTNHDLKWLSDSFFGTNYIGNEQNLAFQQEANAKNEALLRESWSREDNAVQRRVADLKAAGLSPTLAAGSAASSSGPIRLNSLESNPGISGQAEKALSLITAKKSLEHMQLQNDLLGKQIENYGKPDWMVALNEIFGADKFSALLRGLGDKFYDMLFPTNEDGSPSTYSGSSTPSEVPTTKSTNEVPGTSGRLTFNFVSELQQKDMYDDWIKFNQNFDKYCYYNTGDLTDKGNEWLGRFIRRYGISKNDGLKIVKYWYNTYKEGVPGVGQGGGGGSVW